MAQDLRELYKEQRETQKFHLKSGHEDRFLERLEVHLSTSKKTKRPIGLGIAASLVVLVGLAILFFMRSTPEEPLGTTIVDSSTRERAKSSIGLGDLSPDLEKIENYYVTNINLALSKLEVSKDNKELVDGYLERLNELNQEYEALNQELNQLGPNDQTIAAMVQNLQLRAQLLQKLNQKLNQLKSSRNEQKINVV